MTKFEKMLESWNGNTLRGAKKRLSLSLNVADTTISAWCAGRIKPAADKIEKMAEIFGTSEEEIKAAFNIPQTHDKPQRIFAEETQLVPILGVSSAGNKMFILEETKGYLTTRREGPKDFAIQVIGHCMEDPDDARQSIYDGDFVIVRPDVDVRNGDVVVARIGEESTLKRFFLDKETNTIYLVPDNPEYKPLHFPATEVAIVGKVIKKDYPIKSKTSKWRKG